jgi:hypothetical protein
VLGTDEGFYMQLMRGIERLANQAIDPNAPGTWSPD